MLSIAICTYNRAPQLAVLLEQLVLMSEWLYANSEVIVIDNNSSDNTWELLKSYSQVLPLHRVLETNQGLSFGRNRAIEVFKGDALLFLDDDVSVTLATFKSYVELLQQRTDIEYVGGKITVDWQGERPSWLSEERLPLLDGLFGHYDLGEDERVYSPTDPTPFGANFVLRRSLIERVGLFDINLGVVGDKIARGEETDYFNRVRKLGFNGLYSGTCHVGHRFQQERINLRYLYRYGIEKGRAAFLIDNAESHQRLSSSLSFLIRGMYQLCKGRRDRFYQCVINVGIVRGLYRESSLSKAERKNKEKGQRK